MKKREVEMFGSATRWSDSAVLDQSLRTPKETAHMSETTATPETRRKHCSTEDFAKRFLVNPNTIRRALCLKGHYMGQVPLKLPNGRLLWPDVSVEDVVMEEGLR